MRSLLSKVPLSITAPVLLVAPALVVFVVLTTIAFVQGRRAANNLASQELLEIHGRIEGQLTTLFEMPRRINRINASLIRLGRLDLDDLRSWRTYFRDQTQAFDMLSGVLWGDAKGRVVWTFRYPGKVPYEFGIKDEQTGEEVQEFPIDKQGHIKSKPRSSYKYDPRLRPWYKNAVAAGKAAWTEYAWVNEDGSEVTYGLAYPEPYFDAQGKLLGVLDAELSLHDVSRFLASLKIGQTGLAFLIDRQGLLVADSVGLPVHDKKLNRVPAQDCVNGTIAAAGAALSAEYDSLNSVHGTYRTTLDVDGRRQLMVVSPVNPATGVDWLTVTVVPESDFMGEIYEGRRRSILIGLAAVAATLVLGIALAVLAVRPMLQLVEHVQHVGAGDLDRELKLDYSPEFIRLSHEINAMVVGLRDRMRMRHSLALAMDVQKSLLPSEAPQVQGLDVAGHSTYCDETGGDYYDFLEIAGLSENAAAIAVGDVMGHGVAAAMLMATARGVLRSRCQEPGSLGDLLSHLNRMLVEDTGGERFMTMLLLTIDTAQGQVRWASAGHDPPIVFDPVDDHFVTTDEGSGLALGILDEEQYKEHIWSKVRPGQIYIASTDGLWEASNQAGEPFGKERLCDVIRENANQPAEAISRAVREVLTDFCGRFAHEDDITFVIAKVK